MAEVVAQDGAELALKNLASGRIRRVGVGALLGDDSYLPDTPDRLPRLDSAAVLDTLDPETRQRVVVLHRHVVEVLSGSPPPRPLMTTTMRLSCGGNMA